MCSVRSVFNRQLRSRSFESRHPWGFALASSCRILSNSNLLQPTDKKEVFEFHLQWVYLSGALPRFGHGRAK